ncbi:MAG TPA: methylthioribulose 1-phosphate dehydratase [Pirellulales bacterium]|nr:methylthioribulose 1-phosphate dehydratase [Pirellulales bacterium]
MSSQLKNPVQFGRTASEGTRESAQAALVDVGSYLHSRGWSLATSSNYSVVLSRDPLRLLLTASGKDKGRLKRTDFVVVDETGRAVAPTDQRPSAETLLHVALAQQQGVGAVLHTHSVWGTLVSDWRREAGFVRIADYEMLKGLEGIHTHEHALDVPIFDNTQDIAALAAQVEARLADRVHPLQYGFLIHRHGLYTWGRDLDEARRHVEVFEFLFEVVGRSMEPPRRQERPEERMTRNQGGSDGHDYDSQ